MKFISIALLGLFASVAYAKSVCKASPADCPGYAAELDLAVCEEAGFKSPNVFLCLIENDYDGLRVHGRDWRHSILKQVCGGPQRLKNFCSDPGMRCSQDWQCCSGTCSQEGWCY